MAINGAEQGGATSMDDNISRNALCLCGSGLKFKKCCLDKRPLAEMVRQAPSLPRRSAAESMKDVALLTAARRQWAAGRSAEAIAMFRQLTQLRPESADAHHGLGAALCGSGQLHEGARSLERAVELRPSFDAALRVLANALEAMGREAEAAILYRRLARVIRDRTEQRLVLAKALSLEGESSEAELELRRALAAAPDNAGACVLLGQLLIEKGEFVEAEPYLVQAIDEFPDAFQPLAVSRPMTESDRPLLDRMSALAERKDLTPHQRGAIHFGLGKGHDDLQDYAEAMRRYELGNTLIGAATRFDRAGLVAIYDNLIATYSAAALETPRNSNDGEACPEDDLPILIVGMPRSGTTLVEQIVSSHPKVAAGGELSFWSDQVKQALASADANVVGLTTPLSGMERFARQQASRPAKTATEKASLARLGSQTSRIGPASRIMLSQAGKDYQALLRRIGPEAERVTDKAPFNFERLGQIRTALPGIRVIHCRRHPVDTCLSIFFTNYKGRQAWTRADILFHYRQYRRLMDHWRSVLPADRFIEIDYEALIADREAQTRRLIAFCGLDWHAACLSPEQNRRIVRTASVWQARQGAYTGSLERWRRYQPWLGELAELLQDDG